VSDGSGNITIEGVEGSVRVNDGSGNIRARNVTGNFVVNPRSRSGPFARVVRCRPTDSGTGDTSRSRCRATGERGTSRWTRGSPSRPRGGGAHRWSPGARPTSSPRADRPTGATGRTPTGCSTTISSR
jgi:hypothetical protein